MATLGSGTVWSAVLVGALLAPRASAAAEPRLDSVTLVDGTKLTGTIIDFVPDKVVSIRQANGQITTMPWRRVDRVDRNVPSLEIPPGVAATPSTETITVFLEGDEGALELQDESGHWSTTCRAPCDSHLLAGSRVRIGGDGIRPSDAWSLEASNGSSVRLTPNASSSGSYAAGLTLAIVGASAMSLGGLILYVQFALSSIERSQDYTVGLAALGGGAFAMVPGLLLVTSNNKTTVQQSWGGAAPVVASKIRTPDWRTVQAEGPRPTSAGPTLPIFGATF